MDPTFNYYNTSSSSSSSSNSNSNSSLSSSTNHFTKTSRRRSHRRRENLKIVTFFRRRIFRYLILLVLLFLSGMITFLSPLFTMFYPSPSPGSIYRSHQVFQNLLSDILSDDSSQLQVCYCFLVLLIGSIPANKIMKNIKNKNYTKVFS